MVRMANCIEIWEPQPPGTLRACPGLSWDCFTFFTQINPHCGPGLDSASNRYEYQ